ncbi:MAG TPA: hypothetical protein PLN86_16895 [Candidatus Hydrogenedentes bacterium]|nr:hypothetical protein [Candidatus Hydrogenedentota bacterium]
MSDTGKSWITASGIYTGSSGVTLELIPAPGPGKYIHLISGSVIITTGDSFPVNYTSAILGDGTKYISVLTRSGFSNKKTSFNFEPLGFVLGENSALTFSQSGTPDFMKCNARCTVVAYVM